MADTVLVQARVPAELKSVTDEIFRSMGMDTATGIRMFLAQVRLHNGLPFPVKGASQFSDDEREALSVLNDPQTKWYGDADALFAAKGWN